MLATFWVIATVSLEVPDTLPEIPFGLFLTDAADTMSPILQAREELKLEEN